MPQLLVFVTMRFTCDMLCHALRAQTGIVLLWLKDIWFVTLLVDFWMLVSAVCCNNITTGREAKVGGIPPRYKQAMVADAWCRLMLLISLPENPGCYMSQADKAGLCVMYGMSCG